MKVLLAGAGGMLGRTFLKKKPENWDLYEADIDQLDMTNRLKVQKVVRDFNPELILNCAAYTKVDDCEIQKEHAFAVNGEGVGSLAEAASQIGAKLVHFSTDYIFDGSQKRPYSEEDPSAPVNVYGASKWEGECQLRKHLDNYLLIRTQWLYGEGGSHFVKTILNLAKKQAVIKVVDDQIGSPTWTEDLAGGVLGLIQKEASGTFHLVNRGVCSWYQFACRIIQEAGISAEVIPCSTAEFPRPARRPSHAVLATAKAVAALGKSLSPWEVALERFMVSKWQSSASVNKGFKKAGRIEG